MIISLVWDKTCDKNSELFGNFKTFSERGLETFLGYDTYQNPRVYIKVNSEISDIFSLKLWEERMHTFLVSIQHFT
jgi:hypothetical protein